MHSLKCATPRPPLCKVGCPEGVEGLFYAECSYFLFISENVGADAHIGPCNIRERLGRRRGDVGIAPYKLNVASP